MRGDLSPLPSGTPALLVHASRPGHPHQDKYFQAMMTWDEDGELRPGDHAIVTLTIADQQAACYLDAGRPFTLWGSGIGHGVIARRVYTTAGPS
jgi:hypothetical protein